jgi:hypothetical protein
MLVFRFTHLIVKMIQLITVLFVLAANVVKSLVLLLGHLLHCLGISFKNFELLCLVLKLILKSAYCINIVRSFELLPHLCDLLLQFLEGSCLLLYLLVLVLQGSISFKFALYFSSSLFFKLSYLSVHLGDDIKKLGFELLVDLHHSLYGVRLS